MPIYEYRCGACGHHLEALQKMAESPLRKCPECGKSQLKRLVSASRFRLKGSGWYETDFKNDKEKKRNLVEAASADSGDTASDKPADTAAKQDSGKANEDAGKAAAAAKKDEPAAPPARRKAVFAKPAPATRKVPNAKRAAVTRKPAAKPRAKAARG